MLAGGVATAGTAYKIYNGGRAGYAMMTLKLLADPTFGEQVKFFFEKIELMFMSFGLVFSYLVSCLEFCWNNREWVVIVLILLYILWRLFGGPSDASAVLVLPANTPAAPCKC